MVLEFPTKTKRRNALKTLPPDLYETFEAVITRIKELPSGRANLGVQVLMWLHLAYRPFQLEELQHALSVETGQTEFDPDNIPSQKMLLDSCLGLVIHDEETGTIRFVHYTLEEYFRRSGDRNFPDGCSRAAEICLTYINFGELATHCETMYELRQKVKDFAFLKYAAVNWGHYVARILGCSDTVRQLAFKTLEHTGKTLCPLQVMCSLLPNTYILLRYQLNREYASRYIVTDLSGVHVAAYFGLVEFIKWLCLVKHRGADMKDDEDRTPLIWAAQAGNEGVVNFLLARDDVDVNSKDFSFCQTPLSRAAENGHEGVVKALLARNNVVVNTEDKYDRRTPLSFAAGGGHEAVVKLLFVRDDVDITAQSFSGMTAADYAREYGHHAIADLISSKSAAATSPV